MFSAIANKKAIALLLMLIVFFNSNAQISGSENIYFASDEKVVYITQVSPQKIISVSNTIIYISEDTQIEIVFFTEYYNGTAYKKAHSVRPPPSAV